MYFINGEHLVISYPNSAIYYLLFMRPIYSFGKFYNLFIKVK